jgi:hypothetical protein
LGIEDFVKSAIVLKRNIAHILQFVKQGLRFDFLLSQKAKYN